jgi:membrane-bound lytic murein transglycosylase D
VFAKIGQISDTPAAFVLNFPVRKILSPLVLLALFSMAPAHAQSETAVFAMPSGLEGAVEFWKQIFTRYSFGEVVFFDPMDPGTIYSSLRAPDNDAGRALIDRERARIVADYDLIDDETRIRAQRGAKEHFAEGLRISGRYIREMQKIFRAEGLPENLAYLPLVESSFNVRARSVVGAVGMWQFMPETGKKFLRIDGPVDERRDPFASTRAAARLLKENYRLLGNWPLAITAYNHGTDGIFRGVKSVESDNLVDLIRGYQSPTFGFASRNFYAEFLAVVDIATHSESYFPFLRAHAPVALREVALKRSAPLQPMLKPAAISQSDFFEWNPALDPSAKVIPAGYRVKLPPDKVDDFLAAERRMAAEPVAKKTPATRPKQQTVKHTARVAKPAPARKSAVHPVRAASEPHPTKAAAQRPVAKKPALKVADR